MTPNQTQHPDSRGSEAPREPTNEERVEAYLRQQAEDTDGDLYIKSRDVAAATELSAKQVGPLIARLQREGTELSIERWAYSNSTTWRVVTP